MEIVDCMCVHIFVFCNKIYVFQLPTYNGLIKHVKNYFIDKCVKFCRSKDINESLQCISTWKLITVSSVQAVHIVCKYYQLLEFKK